MKGTERGRPPSRPGAPRQQSDTTRPTTGTRETFSRFVSNLAKLESERARSGKGEARR